jgi:hypothetical protein
MRFSSNSGPHSLNFRRPNEIEDFALAQNDDFSLFFANTAIKSVWPKMRFSGNSGPHSLNFRRPNEIEDFALARNDDFSLFFANSNTAIKSVWPEMRFSSNSGPHSLNLIFRRSNQLEKFGSGPKRRFFTLFR